MSEVIVNALSVYEKDLSSYRELLEVANLAPNTVKNYMDYVGRFANWLIDTQNSMPLQDVTSRIVREYILHLKDQSLKGNTINQHVAAIRYLYEGVFSITWNHKAVPVLKYQKISVRVPTTNEVVCLLKSVPEINIWIEISLMAFCGLRIEEVSELRFMDIRRERGTIYVQPSKGREDREVPLPSLILDRLVTYCRMLDHPKREDYIFPGRKPGTHVTTTTLENHVNRALERIGWQDRGYTCHKLRHHYGCIQYLAHPDDLKRLAVLMGHHSLRSTEVYIQAAASFKNTVESTAQIIEILKGAFQ